MRFYTKCDAFVQDCVDLRWYFLLQIVCTFFSEYIVFYVFKCVYAYSVDVVEVAPPGATEDHRSCWDMQTQDYHFCCICLLVLSVQQL